MNNMYDILARLKTVSENPTVLTESAVVEKVASDTGKRLLTKSQRSTLAKQARAGKDIGKPGKKFKDVAAAAGGGEKGARIAAAAMFKGAAKRMHEDEVEEGNPYAHAVLKAKQAGAKPGDKIDGPGPGTQDITIKEKMSPARAKSFAALAPPKDKITYADKIAGARKGTAMKEASTDDDDDYYGIKKSSYKTSHGGSVTRDSGVTKHKAGPGRYGGYDPDTDPDKDDDKPEQPAGEKRGRGRPKGTGGPRQERVTAKSRKQDRTAHGQQGFKAAKPGTKKVKENERSKYHNDLDQTSLHWSKEVRDLEDPQGKATKYVPNRDQYRVHTGAVAPDAVKDRIKRRQTKGGPAGPKWGQMLPREGVEENDFVPGHDRGEYDREGEMAKQDLKTAKDAAAELRSILDSDENLPEWVQSKITKAVDYLDTARDYMKSKDDELEPMTEKAVSGAQQAAAAIALKAKRSGSKPKSGTASAAMAKMSTKELEKFAKTKRKGLPKHVAKENTVSGTVAPATTQPKPTNPLYKGVTNNVPSPPDMATAPAPSVGTKQMPAAPAAPAAAPTNPAYKGVTKNIPSPPDMATAPAPGKKPVPVKEKTVEDDKPSKKNGGMIFGKGVYEAKISESYNQHFEKILNEGISLNASMDQDGKQTLNVTATDEDAAKLAEIIRLAGMDQSGGNGEVCDTCGSAQCGCDHVEEDLANSPDVEISDADTMTKTLSGGLNGMKSTGQTTVPVLNRDPRRQVTTEELEQRLWNVYTRYTK